MGGEQQRKHCREEAGCRQSRSSRSSASDADGIGGLLHAILCILFQHINDFVGWGGRTMRRTAMIPLLLAACLTTHAARASDPPRMVVFDIELYDTSGLPAQPEQEARLRLLTAELRDRLAASGRYAVIAIPPPPGAALRNCNGCEVTEAARHGAELVMTGLVQKVSNLILHLTLTIREVPSGAVHGSWYADFRGNTDESWQNALRWLLRNRVLTQPAAAPR
jgi:hypothetical protein